MSHTLSGSHQLSTRGELNAFCRNPCQHTASCPADDRRVDNRQEPLELDVVTLVLYFVISAGPRFNQILTDVEYK